ncbi:hypothetical protein [Streptomyces sp. PTD5-9]|uniref:hypothetical protein n=1 Tax=Streptomyces sp. PTD5-9 TaxID=3120150 RepID=UPI003009BAAA
MRRQTLHSTGRRGTVIAASAAVLCLGGALAACAGGTAGEAYVAVGAAGTERTPSGAVAPSGKVTLVPLDRRGADGGPGPDASATGPGGAGTGTAGTGAAGGNGSGTPPGGAGAPGSTGNPAGTGGAGAGHDGAPAGTGGAGADGGTGRGGGTGGSPGTGPGGGAGGGAGGPGGDPSGPSSPGPSVPPGPPVLTVGAPQRAAADERWCEKVTVEFTNTGGSPARAGTVTFATHVIGGLGVDWATIESSAPLPTPIGAGATRTKTYTVCVDAWRVPLGMHVETRDVTAAVKDADASP